MSTLTPEQVTAVVLGLLGLGIAAIWVRAYRTPLRLLWLQLWANLPIVGPLGRLSANPDLAAPHDPDRNPIITRAEVMLVNALDAVAPLTAAEYAKRMAWLRKVGDHQVRLNGAPLLLTAVLLFAFGESYGFSWVIGPYLKADIDQNTLRTLATSAGLAVAVITFAATWLAGASYRRAKTWTIHQSEWRRAGRPFLGNHAPVAPDQDQSVDDDLPVHAQFMARAQRVTWGTRMPIMVLLTVVLIGIATCALRYIDLQREEALIAAPLGVPGLDLLLVFGNTIAIGVLLLIYVAVQIMGFVHGYSHALNSPLSAAVWDEIDHQPTYRAYLHVQRRRQAMAQRLFNTLQERQGVPNRSRMPSLREVQALVEDEEREIASKQEVRGVWRVIRGDQDLATTAPHPTKAPPPGEVAS